MKHWICLIVIFLLPTALLAEGWIIGAGGGVSSHYGGHTRNVGTFQIGGAYEFLLSDDWTFSPGLRFAAKGWKDRDRVMQVYDDNGHAVTDENGQPIMGKMNVTSNTNYVELPLLFTYSLSLKGEEQILLSVGPYVGYGIGGNTKTRGDTQQSGAARLYYSHSTFSRSDMNRFDGGLTMGVAYQFSPNMSVGVSSDFGMLRSSKSGGKNVAFLLSLGYRF